MKLKDTCSKITVDGDYSHEIKRCLLLRRKAMTNLDNVLKSRDIVLASAAHILKNWSDTEKFSKDDMQIHEVYHTFKLKSFCTIRETISKVKR